MDTSIRELKAQLSQLLRQVEAGSTVTVTTHNRPIAEIIPVRAKPKVYDFIAEAGISWNGKKPTGLRRPESVEGNSQVSDWVVEDRR